MKKTVYTNYDELPVMLAVPDVAQIMGIALDGAYTLVRSKDFPAFKVGNRIIIPKDKFLAWLDKMCCLLYTSPSPRD